MSSLQRLGITFGRGPEIKYVAHLDLLRAWQRALRRAGLPLAYSQGYSPYPRISLACPLPVGITSQGELLECYLRQPQPLKAVWQALEPCLPSGLCILKLEELPAAAPSLASLVRWTDYDVDVPTDGGRQEVAQAISRLMALTSLPWQHMRDTGTRHYDLRPLVISLEWHRSVPGAHTLRMRLRWDGNGAGRPEQVVAALGLPTPARIHRLEVGLAQG